MRGSVQAPRRMRWSAVFRSSPRRPQELKKCFRPCVLALRAVKPCHLIRVVDSHCQKPRQEVRLRKDPHRNSEELQQEAVEITVKQIIRSDRYRQVHK